MSNGESQEKLLLWVFSASDGRMGELTHTYAHTENEARQQLQAWMAEQVTFGRENIEVKHWPGGFMAGYRFHWPGSIPTQQLKESEAGHATTE